MLVALARFLFYIFFNIDGDHITFAIVIKYQKADNISVLLLSPNVSLIAKCWILFWVIARAADASSFHLLWSDNERRYFLALNLFCNSAGKTQTRLLFRYLKKTSSDLGLDGEYSCVCSQNQQIAWLKSTRMINKV